jgi:hypothetical protein
MPTTPNRGWTYPTESQNPYYATIVGFFEAQDTDVHNLFTSVRSVPLGGTGAGTFTAGQLLAGNGTDPIVSASPLAVTATGMSVISPNTVSSADTKVGLLLDRVYDAVGDTQEIVFGNQGTGVFASASVAGAVKVIAYDPGETALTIGLQAYTGSVSGYTNEVFRVIGRGIVTIPKALKIGPVTDPPLSEPSYSFGPTLVPRALFVDHIVSSASGNGVCITGQIDVLASAGPTGSSQGVAGQCRVQAAQEAYGVFGYVDWQHAGAYGAGGIFVTRGQTADPGPGGYGQNGINVTSEGNYPGSSGIFINSSNPPANNWHNGLMLQGTLDYGLRVGTAGTSQQSAGVGISVANSNTPGAKIGLYLDRLYGAVGDSQEIVFGANGTGTWAADNKMGALKMLAVGAGEAAITLSAQTGVGNGYTNEIARFAGTGATTLAGLAGTGSRVVFAEAAGKISASPRFTYDDAAAFLTLQGATDNYPFFVTYAFASAGAAYSGFATRKARGSPGAPTAVGSGDPLGSYGFSGRTATTYAETVKILSSATENWSDTAGGSALWFQTTSNGTMTPSNRLGILHNGVLEVANLAGTGTRYVVVNAAGQLAAGATVP